MTFPTDRRPMYYVLNDDHSISPTDDVMVWATMFETGQRNVDRTDICGCMVSTVFVGLDLSFGDGPPIVFETLVFGGPYDQQGERYATWDEAVAGHARWVEAVVLMTEERFT